MAKRLYIQLYNAKLGESITLPLNPESTDITTEQDIQTYNILGFGEVPVRGNRTLQRINLSGLLPDQDSTLALLASLVKSLEYKIYSLEEANTMLDRWCEDNNIIRVIISGKLNKEFIVERKTSTIKEYSNNEGYSFDLVEYRNPERAPEIMQDGTGENNVVKLKDRPINKYIDAEIIGKIGQTIYKLAKLIYGGKFKELMEKNGITDANLDIAGKVIEMIAL